MRFPGLKDVGKGPMGWTRLYGIGAETKVQGCRLAADLLHGRQGRERAVTYTAKDWYLKYGVGYAFKSLDKDPDIIEAQQQGGIRPRRARAAVRHRAGAREHQARPGTTTGTASPRQQIQNALLRQIKPQEALAASAKKAQDLKKAS